MQLESTLRGRNAISDQCLRIIQPLTAKRPRVSIAVGHRLTLLALDLGRLMPVMVIRVMVRTQLVPLLRMLLAQLPNRT